MYALTWALQYVNLFMINTGFIILAGQALKVCRKITADASCICLLQSNSLLSITPSYLFALLFIFMDPVSELELFLEFHLLIFPSMR